MAFINNEDWADYENVINEFHNDAFQQSVLFRRLIRDVNLLGSDQDKPLYKDLEIKGLVLYNHFRTWPINTQTLQGDIDKESVMLFLNSKYLEDLGLLNDNRLLKFNPVKDRFIIDGQVYKPSGDSKTSQTNDKTLLNFIVLRKDILETGEDRY